MNIRINAGLFTGILFSLLSAVIYFITPMEVKIIEEAKVNARTFPFLIITVMGICSVLQIFFSITSREKEYWVINKKSLKSWVVPMETLIIVAIYVYLISWIGFLFTSVVTVIGMLAFLKSKKVSYYLISVGFAISIFLIFTKLLQVALPMP